MSSIAILIVHDVLRLDEKLIIEELRKRNVQFYLINLDNLIFDTSEIFSTKLLSNGNVALMRSVSHTRSELFSKLLEEIGLKVINPSDVISLGNNKFLSLIRLSKYKIPVPRSILALTSEKAIEAFKLILNSSGPLIIKPISGSWGRMVSLVCRVDELKLLVKHKSKMENPLMKIFMLQEYLEKPGRDIRVIVVEDRAVAGIYRYAPLMEWRTNTARGGKAEPIKIDTELEEISVKASKAIGAMYSGVDLVETKDGYVVLEVNVVPEFKNVMRVTGINVAGEIVDMLISHLRR